MAQRFPRAQARTGSPWLALAVALVVAGCSRVPTVAPPPPVGADRDAHGCIGSAGYRWCAREGACVRPWELAADRRLPDSPDAVARYCAG
jgi:hypothetical protein